MMESLFGADLEDSDNDSRGTPRRDDVDEAVRQEQVNVDIEEEYRDFEDDVDVERTERDDESGGFQDDRINVKARRSEDVHSDDEDDVMQSGQRRSRKTEPLTANVDDVSPPVLHRDTERALFGDSESDSEKDKDEDPARLRRDDLRDGREAEMEEREERWEDEDVEERGNDWTDREREGQGRDEGDWEEREHRREREGFAGGEGEREYHSVAMRDESDGERPGRSESQSGKAGSRQGSGPPLDLALDLVPPPAAAHGKVSASLREGRGSGRGAATGRKEKGATSCVLSCCIVMCLVWVDCFVSYRVMS